MKKSIVPIAVFLTCFQAGMILTRAAGLELTDDDWASASPATFPSLLLNHGDRRQAFLAPCTNGYFYVYGDNLTAIGNLVTPTGVAKWDGREWLPASEAEDPRRTWGTASFNVGEEYYSMNFTGRRTQVFPLTN